MRSGFIFLSLLCYATAMTAQNYRFHTDGNQANDSTDVFYRHLQLNEVMVTGVTGDTRLKHSTAPISVVTGRDLRQTTWTNIIDAVAMVPGMAQITTGGGISKPIIRGLGYNRIIVMNEGVRQEGQQWGDEHGIEVDAQNVGSVEVLRGPASLMYGSDAMAGVLILHDAPSPLEGEVSACVGSEFQTNNGLFAYSVNGAGNHGGFVWDARFSDKMAHAYKNRYDGYVPGSQFHERGGRLMLGLERRWGLSHLRWTAYHLTPSIAEGERDEVTGELVRCEGRGVRSYHRSLPFQQVKHYKAVWDNSLNFPHGWLKAIVGYQQNRRQEFEESAADYEVFFKLHTVTYDVRYLTREFDGWKLATGVNGMWQKSRNLGEEALIPEYRLFDMGGYATVSRSWERWTLNGGLRYDHRHLSCDAEVGSWEDYTVTNLQNRHFEGMTGSVGTVWNANDHFNVRLNLARGFRAPNMSELGSDGVHEGTVRYELGNPKLDAEYSWQADLGVDFESHYVSAQVALFANRISHYIFAQRIGAVMEEGYNTYEYTQGDARLLGFEAGIDIHPIHSLHFGSTFSYVDARQLDQPEETRYLPFTPAPRLTSELKYEITHDGRFLNNIYVALGMECYLRQNHYYREGGTETATPSYTLLNLSVGTDLLLRKKKVAELYVTADNLLNRAYQSHLSRLKYTDINCVTGRQGIYNMGRNIVFKVVIPMLWD